MGRNDKHKTGQSRNSSVFKVMGGKHSKSKKKAKEVTTRLKNIKHVTSKDLDSQLDVLRSKSVKISGSLTKKEDGKIEAASVLSEPMVTSENVDILADAMTSSMQQSSSSPSSKEKK